MKRRYILLSLVLFVFLLLSADTLTLYAKENGFQVFSFSASGITEEDKIPLDDAVIGYDSMIYTGQPRTQTINTVVTAIEDGKTVELKKNRDFKVRYENNLNAGTAAMTIIGTGKYTGTIVKHFKIRPVSLASAELKYKKAEYTGKPITLTPAATVRARVATQMRTLKSQEDYTITYESNTDVGTAAMIITGKGNYTGTLKETFEIIPPAGSDADIKCSPDTLPADIKQRFCEWYFTFNCDDRWSAVSRAFSAASEQSSPPVPSKPGITPVHSDELDRSLEAYFSPVEEITTDDFRKKMLMNRDPFKYDQLFSEAGAESELQSVEFAVYDEKETYTVYEFTAVLKLEHYEDLDPSVIKHENGAMRISGQITVEDGCVTKIFFRD